MNISSPLGSLVLFPECVEIPGHSKHHVAGQVVELRVNNRVCADRTADVLFLSKKVVGADGEGQRFVGKYGVGELRVP